MDPTFDVVIAGSGPAGLSAALILGRGNKRVLLADAGPRRNAAAHAVNGFVTQDGTPPQEMRNIARAQLAKYPTVTVRDVAVTAVQGSGEAPFDVTVGGERVRARRVLLCAGLVDELPAIPGFAELWGTSIFACPYCHAFELGDVPFGVLVADAAFAEYPLLMTGWSSDVLAFTDARFAVPDEVRARLRAGGVRLEERKIRRLVAGASGLEAVELDDGARVARAVLFSRTAQKQTELVRALSVDLGVALDDNGYVKVDEHMRTSRAGISAAGDLTTMQQSAILAAAAGAKAAYMLNHELTIEAALAGRRATPSA